MPAQFSWYCQQATECSSCFGIENLIIIESIITVTCITITGLSVSDKNIPLVGATRSVNYAVYTVGDLASGIYSVVPSILLMFYMTNVLGVPVALATLAGFIPKVVDLIASSVIAALSDRTRTRLGRRRPYLLFGSLTALPCFAAIWMAPYASPTPSAYYILATFCLCTVTFSCFTIPFFALNADLARDYHDRTRLNGFRTAYTFVGAILAGAGAPLIVDAAGGGREGYRYMGLFMGVIMALVTFTTFIAAREPVLRDKERVPSIREAFSAIISNAPYVYLSTAYALYIMSAGLFGAVLAYFVTYVLERGAGFLSLVFFLKYGVAIAAIPAWSWVSKGVGKLVSFQICLVFVVASSLAYLFIEASTPTWMILVVVALYGTSASAVQVFAFSMLADCIHHGSGPGAQGSAAMFNGVFLAGEKLGYAAGALLSGIILGAAGLIETTQGAVAQPQSAINGIRLSLSLGPVVLNGLVMLILVLYRPFERRMLAHSAAESTV